MYISIQMEKQEIEPCNHGGYNWLDLIQWSQVRDIEVRVSLYFTEKEQVDRMIEKLLILREGFQERKERRDEGH